MKVRGCARLVWIVGLTIFGIATSEARSRAEELDSSALDVERRWIPSASFFSMGMVDQRTAQMSAEVRLKPQDPLLDREGQSRGVPWSIGGSFDIATPVLLDMIGRPRGFAHADVGFVFDGEDPVVTRFDPGLPPVLPPNQTNSIGILNAGAAVRAEAKPLVLSGGFGPVFSFDAFERGFRFRPTLEWIYRRDTMKNYLGAGESEGATASCVPPVSCRTVFIKSQTEKGYHSIGPGFELEADVGRAGQFLIGFYGSFRAYYLVGDRKANLKSTGSWFRTDNGQPSSRADTTFVTRYEREPWHYRFGAGIRILWSPEE